MKVTSFAACLALFVFVFVPAHAFAQFGFGFGGGNSYGGGDHGGGNYGGGGISIGFGSGGISIGSGGYGDYGHGGHDGHHGDGHYHQPSWGINSGSNWNNNNGYYQRPRSNYSEAPVVKPKPAPKPVANLKPAATDPKDNKIRLIARHISADEVARAKTFFQQRLQEFTKTIDLQLPATDADIGAVLARLAADDIAADVQIQLIDALRSGNIGRAGEIWRVACPGEPVPFGMPRMRVRFASFRERMRDGTCTMDDLAELQTDLSAMGMNDEPCCGAESLLEDIEQHLRIGQAVARAVPGKPSLQVAIPSGEVDIVYHPGLPDSSIVVLDAETVMVGTGGIGKFEMDRGNVAAAVGYPLATGQALPDDESKLIRSGVLLENETQDAINYLLDNSQFKMEPGYKQTIASGKPVIKFDRGNGSKKPASYTLADGTYRFTIKNRAFDVYQAKFGVTIDNSQNSEPFNYIVQGEHAVVAAGQSQTHNSNYPIVLRYDRGNGGAVKQVLCNELSSVLQVAVNPADNLWDLFRPASASKSADGPPADGDYAPAF